MCMGAGPWVWRMCDHGRPKRPAKGADTPAAPPPTYAPRCRGMGDTRGSPCCCLPRPVPPHPDTCPHTPTCTFCPRSHIPPIGCPDHCAHVCRGLHGGTQPPGRWADGGPPAPTLGADHDLPLVLLTTPTTTPRSAFCTCATHPDQKCCLTENPPWMMRLDVRDGTSVHSNSLVQGYWAAM